MRRRSVWLASILMATACNAAVPPVESSRAVDTTGAPAVESTTTTTPPRDCTPAHLTGQLPTAPDLEPLLIEASRAVFPCADVVVVAAGDDGSLEAGARRAIADGAAFLVADAITPSDAVVDEVERLAPLEVVLVGVAGDRFEDSTRLISEVAAGDDVAPPLPDAGDTVWLASPEPVGLAQALAPLAAAAGATVVEAPDGDLRLVDAETRTRLSAADDVIQIGSFHQDAGWQLAVVRAGLELPGGGQVMFPDRRLVAFYGSPYAPALGALGEQDPAATVERMAPLIEQYRTDDGVVVIPTFEIIATVASARAGDDDDYSYELSIDDLRPWVEFAGENGVYVLLDLQPGRTDFLTQAKRYEELLALPHVGLALDPEWRLGPNQVHLRQIGTVTGAEINTVVDWLAELVRTEALPQKMLLLHQFKLSMITERETIETPPELAVVIQMDGQGPLGSKYGTLDAMVAGTEEAGWLWGWKNFFDEDSPMATPEQTLAVEPQPVYVSYQ